jgi:mRNA-degrading endonuclease RelE of RelBE toxin-antitoxin system
LRWRAAGRGKRGGFRIIYYLRSKQGEIWLLTLYAKNVAESISGQILRKIKEEIDG